MRYRTGNIFDINPDKYHMAQSNERTYAYQFELKSSCGIIGDYNYKIEKSARPPSELRLQIYIRAIKAENESEEYKAAVLLNCIGDKALKIYNTFEFEKEGDKFELKNILKKVEAYFTPSINVTLERYIFFTRDMEESESVDEYVVTQLKHSSKNCQF